MLNKIDVIVVSIFTVVFSSCLIFISIPFIWMTVSHIKTDGFYNHDVLLAIGCIILLLTSLALVIIATIRAYKKYKNGEIHWWW